MHRMCVRQRMHCAPNSATHGCLYCQSFDRFADDTSSDFEHTRTIHTALILRTCV